MFGWYRNRKRARLKALPFPPAWLEIVQRNLPYYAVLPESLRRELLELVQVFVSEKHFEGCGGFRLTDESRVSIAAHACVLLLNRETTLFADLVSILVYPTSFYVDEPEVNEAEAVVTIDDDARAGESWDRGVVILAWDEIELSFERRDDGYNVVLHEFAHQLDQENRWVEGTPIGMDPGLRSRWASAFTKSYNGLVRDVWRRRPTLMDEYGASDPAEFFAVATETFFELPLELRADDPDLYGVLRDYYRQDPAEFIEQARNLTAG